MDIKRFMAVEGEKPLDNLVSDGGFTGIFRSIGSIGDSLSSGEFEVLDDAGNKSYHDCFDFSWGQYLARMAGTTVINMSRGGMTAKEYCTSFGEKHDYFNKEKACGAYIIALGVNDVCNMHMEIGSVSDINRENPSVHPDTFAGWYGELLLRYREISPGAKFFIVSIPREIVGENDEWHDSIAEVHTFYNELAEAFDNTYLIDLYEYGPVYDEEFKKEFFMIGHMNPMGYMLTAKMFASYIDYIIRHNPKEFELAGMIPAQYHCTWL